MNVGKRSRFGLLLENLEMVESSFADSDLEREILGQLSRLGALSFFDVCFLRNLNTSNIMDLAELPIQKNGLDSEMSTTTEDCSSQVVVRTGKKEERRLRRERATSKNGTSSTSPPLSQSKNSPFASFDNYASSSKRRRIAISRNEAEISKEITVEHDGPSDNVLIPYKK